MRDHSDQALVARVHLLEAYGREDDATLLRLFEHRSKLSREAWLALAEKIGCDSGPLAKVGVMAFPLHDRLAAQLLQSLLASPRTKMRRHDFTLGYVSTGASQCTYLNTCNEYRRLTPASRALVGEFLSMAGPAIEAAIGHPFRVASLRQFQLVPNRPLADRHVDGWPVAIRKVFVLPQGCGKRTSTTWFRQRDGVEFTLESERPIWMLFENSVVLHEPVSGVALRPTIEIDIVPAPTTSLEPVYVGLAGWYPTFPTRHELLAGTRKAFTRCTDDGLGDLPDISWPARLAGILTGAKPLSGHIN